MNEEWPHQHSVCVAALCGPIPLSLGVFQPLWGRGIVAEVRVLAAELGLHWRGGAGETRRQLYSGQQSPSQGGPRRGYEASGPALNKKTAAICLHCYLCFKCMTGCRCKWGSLNLLPFRLLPQSLTWQVTSFKKHCVRMFPPLLFKWKQRERRRPPQRFKWLKWTSPQDCLRLMGGRCFHTLYSN